jgi:hypothetical protein
LKFYFQKKSLSLFFAEFTYSEARAYFSPEVDNPKFGGFSMFLERANFASAGTMVTSNSHRSLGRGKFKSGNQNTPDAPIAKLTAPAKAAGFSDVAHWNEYQDHPKVYQLKGSDFEGEMGFASQPKKGIFPAGRVGKMMTSIANTLSPKAGGDGGSTDLARQQLQFGMQSIAETGYEAKDKSTNGPLVPAQVVVKMLIQTHIKVETMMTQQLDIGCILLI